MADCESLPKCPFFNDKMASMPAAADLLKALFSRSDFATCARFRVAKALGAGAVPLDLYPTDAATVQALLANHPTM